MDEHTPQELTSELESELVRVAKECIADLDALTLRTLVNVFYLYASDTGFSELIEQKREEERRFVVSVLYAATNLKELIDSAAVDEHGVILDIDEGLKVPSVFLANLHFEGVDTENFMQALKILASPDNLERLCGRGFSLHEKNGGRPPDLTYDVILGFRQQYLRDLPRRKVARLFSSMFKTIGIDKSEGALVQALRDRELKR